MNYFDNIKMYKAIITILVVINVFAVGSIWFMYSKINQLSDNIAPSDMPGPPEKFERTNKYLFNELNLDKHQRELFRIERNKHFNEVKVLKDSIFSQNQKLFELVFTTQADSDQIIAQHDKILQLQQKIDRLKVLHFLKLSGYCNEDQRAKLKHIFHDLFIRGMKDEKPGRHQERRNLN